MSHRIGASRAAKACGIIRGQPEVHRSLRAAWEDKPINEDLSQNADVRRGNLSEPMHACELIKLYDGEDLPDAWCQEDFCYNPEYPWANCLPDMYEKGSDVGVELKAPKPWTVDDILLKKGLPHSYIMQCQHSMAITGARRWGLSLWHCIDYMPYWFWIDRDDALIASMMAKEKELYDFAVKNEKPAPDPRLDPQDTKWEEEEFADTDPAYKTLDTPDAYEAARIWMEAREQVEQAKANQDLAKKNIIELFGDDIKVGDVPGCLRFHNKMQKGRAKFDKKAFLEANPAMVPVFEKHTALGAPFAMFKGYPKGDFKSRYGKTKKE